MKLLSKTALLLMLGLTPAVLCAQKITASYTPGALNARFSGKVLLYLSKENRQPREAMAGVEDFPCFSITVTNIAPGQKVTFDDGATSYPAVLSGIERGTYYAQVVWDRNLGGSSVGGSPGNLYNSSVRLDIGQDRSKIYNIECSRVIKGQTFTDTRFAKEMRQPSRLLSTFYGRPVTLNAAVLLPREYDEQPGRRFPVLYWISGFGGDYHHYSGSQVASEPIDTTACIRVFLDGRCPGGHCVYANSDNNVPWGDALIQELIPAVEKTYRCDGTRLLKGHSSGGWSVLWLQTHYPNFFDGCWSSSPDPVDFRSFQQVNLYSDRNIYYDGDSALRMAATVAGRYPWITMKTMLRMERVIYRGEQMHSFDAVFSQKGPDGEPRRLCNSSGQIDKETVAHWKKYDISLYLRSHWQDVAPDLRGKVRVSVGNQDNFLLNYAVHLLDAEMEKIQSGFVFAYYPGDHFTVATPQYDQAGYRFLEEQYLKKINKSFNH